MTVTSRWLIVRSGGSVARLLLVAVVATVLSWVGLVALGGRAAEASPSQLADFTAGVNGTVYDTEYVVDSSHPDGRTFMVGEFSWAGPRTASAVPVDTSTGTRTSVPRVNGPVHAAAADLSGGWYVGGEFVFAGGKTRNNAARVSGTGGVTAWDPNVNGAVRALAVQGGVVYLGGSFSSVGGQARNNLAAVAADTGAVLPWNPGSSSAVDALAVSADGGAVYTGGGSGVAAFDAATGDRRSWGAVVEGTVHAIAVDAGTVFVGGSAGVAAVDAATGSVAAWTAPTDADVLTIAISGSSLYVGGAFTTVEGSARGGLAALALATGALSDWHPPTNGQVKALQPSADGSAIYLGGGFTSIAGQPRNRTAAVLTSDASVTAWHPSAEADVEVVTLSGSRLLVGGVFDMLNGLPRRNAAALDSNGNVDPLWNPSPDDVTYAVEAASDATLVFLGGKFLNLGTAARSKLAAVNNTTGAPLPRSSWPTGANGNVRALEVSGQRLFVGGAFTRVAGLDTGRLVALSAVDGAVDGAFKPNPGGTVRALVASPGGARLYVAGEFSTIGGASRPGAAELDAYTGALTGFTPSTGGVAIAAGLTPDGSRLFFSTTSNRTYAYDPAVSNTPVYTVRTGGDVQAIAVSATEVYIGGHFTTLPEAKLARTHAASFAVATAAITNWNPAPDGAFGVWTLALTPSGLLMGGDFAKVGGKAQPGFARFTGEP